MVERYLVTPVEGEAREFDDQVEAMDWMEIHGGVLTTIPQPRNGE
jgi:hypothetical protein